MNLESSLQSCTAHRERILQMLVDEPENANLIELRDQLTNAINQLQGTRDMVQRAQGSAPPGGLARHPAERRLLLDPLRVRVRGPRGVWWLRKENEGGGV